MHYGLLLQTAQVAAILAFVLEMMLLLNARAGNDVAPVNSLVPDIDECSLNFHDCHRWADCVDTPRGFTCTCRPGYNGKISRPDATRLTRSYPCTFSSNIHIEQVGIYTDSVAHTALL